MSDWTHVTSKKKPLSVEHESQKNTSQPLQGNNDTLSKPRVRAEFSIHPGSKIFNPATALRELLKAMKNVYPHITLYNMTGEQQFTKTEDIPTEVTRFENLFEVHPHLNRNGGGKIHVHFRITTSISLAHLKDNNPFLNYLK